MGNGWIEFSIVSCVGRGHEGDVHGLLVFWWILLCFAFSLPGEEEVHLGLRERSDWRGG